MGTKKGVGFFCYKRECVGGGYKGILVNYYTMSFLSRKLFMFELMYGRGPSKFVNPIIHGICRDAKKTEPDGENRKPI